MQIFPIKCNNSQSPSLHIILTEIFLATGKIQPLTLLLWKKHAINSFICTRKKEESPVLGQWPSLGRTTTNSQYTATSQWSFAGTNGLFSKSFFFPLFKCKSSTCKILRSGKMPSANLAAPLQDWKKCSSLDFFIYIHI